VIINLAVAAVATFAFRTLGAAIDTDRTLAADYHP